MQMLASSAEENLEPLATGTAATILHDTDDKGTTSSVQNLCYVPKAWSAYFLPPMSPWQALTTFRNLLQNIPPPQWQGFDF
jgi:hypothetical protein